MINTYILDAIVSTICVILSTIVTWGVVTKILGFTFNLYLVFTAICLYEIVFYIIKYKSLEVQT